MKGRIVVILILGMFLFSALSSVVGVAETVNTKSSSSESSNSGNLYAVIMKGPSGGGQFYFWYTRDIWRHYTLLEDECGLTDSHIDLLFNTESSDPYEGFDEAWIDYKSNPSNLQTVLDQFKPGGSKALGSSDMLVFMWISHGGGGTIFETHGGNVHRNDFAGYIDGIQGTQVYIFQPCTSGGWITAVSGPNRIILASCKSNEGEGGWLGKLNKALRGEGDTDPEIGNQDGQVSFAEAWHYAARHVYERQGVHSQIDDNGDSVGHHYLNNGYDINDPSKDGYIAANTFLGEAKLTASAGGPYSQLPGEELQFQGSASGGEAPYSYSWDFGDGSSTSHQQNPTHTYSQLGEYTATLTVNDNLGDTATDQTTVYINNQVPDLDCIGELDWDEVEAGDTVEGFFDVQNIGDQGSSLDLEIIEWPEWGDWTFTPTELVDLKPDERPKTIAVSLVVPELNPEYSRTGEIKVVNKEDSTDFDIIEVGVNYAVRGRTKNRAVFPGLQTIIYKYFPNLQVFLR
jgi:PKD repeat protein